MAYGSIGIIPVGDEHRISRPIPDAGVVAVLDLKVYENDGPDSYLDACRRQFEYLHEDAPRSEDGDYSPHG